MIHSNIFRRIPRLFQGGLFKPDIRQYNQIIKKYLQIFRLNYPIFLFHSIFTFFFFWIFLGSRQQKVYPNVQTVHCLSRDHFFSPSRKTTISPGFHFFHQCSKKPEPLGPTASCSLHRKPPSCSSTTAPSALYTYHLCPPPAPIQQPPYPSPNAHLF